MGLFIDPEACTESTTVNLHHRAFAIYEPGTDAAAISGGRNSLASISQWRDSPTQPWGEFTFYGNQRRMKMDETKKYLAGLERLRAVLAKWESGHEDWEPTEKYEAIAEGERLKVGDLVQIGHKGRLHPIDRLTPTRAYSGEYYWKITVSGSYWQHAGASNKFFRDYPLRQIKP